MSAIDWDISADVAERFWVRVNKSDKVGGCWQWVGATDRDGYGRFTVSKGGKSRSYAAHRFALILASVDLGDFEVDHLCHVRACVNPDHLRLATHKQNSENRAGPQRSNTSGHLGVSWHPGARRWRVLVTHHGRRHHGGHFATLAEAARVAQELRSRLFTHNDVDKSRTSTEAAS